MLATLRPMSRAQLAPTRRKSDFQSPSTRKSGTKLTHKAECAYGILHWLGNRQINGMNHGEYAYGIRHDSPPTEMNRVNWVLVVNC